MSTFAQFDTTEGTFTIRLYDQEAPNTVANFIGLAEGTKEFTDPRTNERKKAPFVGARVGELFRAFRQPDEVGHRVGRLLVVQPDRKGALRRVEACKGAHA